MSPVLQGYASRLRPYAERLESRIRVPYGRLKPQIAWFLPGLVVVALLLRFAMRALGVRPDIPFPGFIYWLSGPLVQPFNGPFPASPRFDYHTTEVASLVAAGVVILIALAVYAFGLLAFAARTSMDRVDAER